MQENVTRFQFQVPRVTLMTEIGIKPFQEWKAASDEIFPRLHPSVVPAQRFINLITLIKQIIAEFRILLSIPHFLAAEAEQLLAFIDVDPRQYKIITHYKKHVLFIKFHFWQ